MVESLRQEDWSDNKDNIERMIRLHKTVAIVLRARVGYCRMASKYGASFARIHSDRIGEIRRHVTTQFHYFLHPAELATAFAIEAMECALHASDGTNGDLDTLQSWLSEENLFVGSSGILGNNVKSLCWAACACTWHPESEAFRRLFCGLAQNFGPSCVSEALSCILPQLCTLVFVHADGSTVAYRLVCRSLSCLWSSVSSDLKLQPKAWKLGELARVRGVSIAHPVLERCRQQHRDSWSFFPLELDQQILAAFVIPICGQDPQSLPSLPTVEFKMGGPNSMLGRDGVTMPLALYSSRQCQWSVRQCPVVEIRVLRENGECKVIWPRPACP